MNVCSIIHFAIIGASMLAGHALAADDDYRMVTVGQNETQMLTTVLATEGNYDSDERKRVCFSSIDSLRVETESNNETNYKYYIKGCAVTTAAAQCPAQCTTQQFMVKVIARGTTLMVDDIDREGASGSDSDSSDSDDRTRTPATGANGTTSNSTATTAAPTSPSGATTVPVATTAPPASAGVSITASVSGFAVVVSAGLLVALQ